jgi:hypothetical protein
MRSTGYIILIGLCEEEGLRTIGIVDHPDGRPLPRVETRGDLDIRFARHQRDRMISLDEGES